MNYSDIKYADMLNGLGVRVSLFVSGCSHGCKNCFNPETWNPNHGKKFTTKEQEEIFEYFRKYSFIRGISILGGDPTFSSNIKPLIKFIKLFKNFFPNKDIWIWSGFRWEEILLDEQKKNLIELCDVLIDGKFQEELKNLSLKWRGSSNQRVIDVKKSLELKQIFEIES